MKKKYVIFKDDDVGKDLEGLKRWIDIVLKNDVNATIGLIGKHMKDQKLREYLKTLDKNRIEIFCHGYSHSHLPFLAMKVLRKNRLFPTEFDRDFEKHNNSLKKYREDEKKYLKTKAVCFGPQGNIWNETVVDALIKNDFKMMFSWNKINGNIFTIPLSGNMRQNSLEEFIEYYGKRKDDEIFTLQFHHADLSDKQFEVMEEVIDFLKNKEKRVFIKPSDLLRIFPKRS